LMTAMDGDPLVGRTRLSARRSCCAGRRVPLVLPGHVPG
jgi:hypothetical protein